MANPTSPARFDISTSNRLGREIAKNLHGSAFGFVLGPIFRTEDHALRSGRNALTNIKGYARGGFDSVAFLTSFRATLASLGGWDTAAEYV